MENPTQEFNVGQIIKGAAGILLIIFTLSTNGIVLSLSTEAIGWNLWSLLLIGIGIWLIYSAIKKWKNKIN